MPFDTTILTEKVERLKDAFENGRFGDALVAALNTGNGVMQQRIFQENVDTKGLGFGVYIGEKSSVSYKKSKNKIQDKRNKAIAGKLLTAYQIKRARAGRQVAKKDLEFTGALRRAMESRIESEMAAVLEFNNDDAAKIARGQENQITNIRAGQRGVTKGNGVKIFRLTEKERELVVEQGQELITQILKPK